MQDVGKGAVHVVVDVAQGGGRLLDDLGESTAKVVKNAAIPVGRGGQLLYTQPCTTS